jgi:hypothetical protein
MRLTSSHECAETVETAAINTVINCLIFTDLKCVRGTRAEGENKSRKSYEKLGGWSSKELIYDPY